MGASTDPEKPAGLGKLILAAKYHNDDATRETAGLELAKRLTEAGEYDAMLRLCAQGGLSFEVERAMNNGVLRAAFIRCKASGDLEALHDLSSRPDVGLELAWHAGMAIIERYSSGPDEKGLHRLLFGNCHDDVRLSAGNTLLRIYVQKEDYSSLLSLAEEENALLEIRAGAGHALIALAAQNGNYPIILRLGSSVAIPADVRNALEGKFEAAAEKAVNDALSVGDLAALEFMSKDHRLSERLRTRASFVFGASESASRPGIRRENLTELEKRLSKHADAHRSTLRPGPKAVR